MPDVSPEEQARIARYLRLDEENLYPLLLQNSEEYRGAAFDPRGQEAAGRKVFAGLEGSLRQALCNDWNLCEKLKDPNVKDGTSLVVLIGDLIAARVAGFPPFLIASLLVKIGLRKVCACT